LDDHISMSVIPETPTCLNGDDKMPVVRVSYTNGGQEITALKPKDVVAQLNREIGSTPSCHPTQPGECVWHTPARFPKVKLIELRLHPGSIEIIKENPEWPKMPARVESAAGTAFDPFAPLAKTDVFAPGGVGVGMKLEQVHARLTAAGFVAPGYGLEGRGCEWTLFRKHEISTRIIISKTVGNAACKRGAVIREMYFDKDDLRPAAITAASTGGDAAARFRDRAGAAAAACTIDQASAASGKITQCNVKYPPQSADIGYADMEYRVTPGKSGSVNLRVNLRDAAEQHVLDGRLPPSALSTGSKQATATPGVTSADLCRLFDTPQVKTIIGSGMDKEAADYPTGAKSCGVKSKDGKRMLSLFLMTPEVLMKAANRSDVVGSKAALEHIRNQEAEVLRGVGEAAYISWSTSPGEGNFGNIHVLKSHSVLWVMAMQFERSEAIAVAKAFAESEVLARAAAFYESRAAKSEPAQAPKVAATPVGKAPPVTRPATKAPQAMSKSASPIQNVAKTASSWGGEVKEGSAKYPMALTLSGDTGTTTYPTLNCSGTLRKMSMQNGDVVYAETVTNQKGAACVDGVWKITMDGEKAVVNWSRTPGETPSATAVLSRPRK
jgi:hypothetical protein